MIELDLGDFSLPEDEKEAADDPTEDMPAGDLDDKVGMKLLEKEKMT